MYEFALFHAQAYAQALGAFEPILQALAGPRYELMKGICILRTAQELDHSRDFHRLLPEPMDDVEIIRLLRDAYRLAYAILRDEDDAQDCVLKAIADVARSAELPRDIRAYFLVAVRRRAYDMLRRRKVERRHRVVDAAAPDSQLRAVVGEEVDASA